MIIDGIKKCLSKSFQLRQRAFFVDPYQMAIASNICRQNSCQSPLYVLALKMHPRAGESECLYSRIVGLGPAMLMSEVGQTQTWPHLNGRSVLSSEADIVPLLPYVCFVPTTEVAFVIQLPRRHGRPSNDWGSAPTSLLS
jgi:hypothetical protein